MSKRIKVTIERELSGDDNPSFNPMGVRNPQRGMRYRYVHWDDPVNRARKQEMGWEPIKAGDPEVSVLNDRTRMKRGRSIGGEQRVGSMVLCRMPEEVYRERIARNRGLIRRRTTGVTAGYRQAIARVTGDGRLAFEDHTVNASEYRDVPAEAQEEE